MAARHHADGQPPPFVSNHVALYGGGFAGRLTPTADHTTDDRAAGGNYDDEGRNGGWVLPLYRDSGDQPRSGQVLREMPLPMATSVGSLQAGSSGITRPECPHVAMLVYYWTE